MVGGGAGAFFGPVHRTAARLDGRFELVAGAFSSRPEAAGEGAALIAEAARSYPDYRQMIATEARREDGVELIAIVTPNHLHYPVAKAALEAGIAVLCEKPLALDLEQARELAALASERDLLFAVAYTYTGYPMVRQAAAMVRAGELGAIRGAQIRYVQDWLATPVESEGAKQAVWRTDPRLAGPGGCLGDIGTHCYNLLHSVTGLAAVALAADLQTSVPGRMLDDDVQIMLRLENGARAGIWATQVAPAVAKNGLDFHIYGDKGGLEWAQEAPDLLRFTPVGGNSVLMRRGGGGLHPAAVAATRLPAGHPEAYFEALGQLYRDIAEHWTQRSRAPLFGARVADGVAGIAFVETAIASSRSNGAWTAMIPPVIAN
jgi:predicted dehydrogenase